MAKDLEEALVNIENKLGGSQQEHMDLGEHLEYIEELLDEGGSGGSGGLTIIVLEGTSGTLSEENLNKVKNAQQNVCFDCFNSIYQYWYATDSKVYYAHVSGMPYQNQMNVDNIIVTLSSGAWTHQTTAYMYSPRLKRHTITINNYKISVILPYSDSIENHTASLTSGVCGILLNSSTSLPEGIGYIFWDVDEWEIWNAAGTQITYKDTCGDVITDL